MTAQTKFGKWEIDAKTGLLRFVDPSIPGLNYEIPLYELNTSAEILDWIFQINEKTWASPTDIGNLVKAIETALGRDVAGSEIDSPINPKERLKAQYGTKF